MTKNYRLNEMATREQRERKKITIKLHLITYTPVVGQDCYSLYRT